MIIFEYKGIDKELHYVFAAQEYSHVGFMTDEFDVKLCAIMWFFS